jgi:signal transduction histidine kinase/ActR/RegA family two-component response regulator
MGREESARARKVRTGILITAMAAYLGSVLVSDVLSRDASGIATLWTANGLLAATLVAFTRRRAMMMLAFAVVAHVGVDLMVGDGWLLSSGETLLDLAESVGAALIARRLFRPHGRVRTISQVCKLLLAVAPLTAAAATISAAVYAAAFGASFPVIWKSWFVTDWLGLATMLPGCLILMDRESLRGFRRSGSEQAAIYGLIAAITYVTFGPTPLQAPFLIFPAMILATVRMGPRGAALGGVIVGSVAGPITLMGEGPASLNQHWDLGSRMHVLELFVATLLVTGLALALALAQQARLKQLLVRRFGAAKASRSRAMAASRAKTEFLATMSHELRTPLNSVLGFTRLLLDRSDLPQEAVHNLTLVDRAGESLLTVVNDVLDYSRVETGKIELHPRPTDLALLVAEVAGIVANAAANKQLELNVTCRATQAQCYLVDDRRLRQVLLNLLNNAIKFTSQGEVNLDVAVRVEDGFDRIRLEVQDTGPGIPLAQRGRLFKPFTQGDGSARRIHGGVGLGLAICKALVDMMGGQIGVDSVEGRGSVFWVDLSLMRVGAAPETAPETAAVTGAPRILLVDDHPMNRELGVALLTLAGCEVETADDGTQAVAAAARPFDAILMDIHMPLMDGIEAARTIRATAGPCSRIPIIALSADALPDSIARCREAGMVDHVAKPIRREVLYATLEKWLGAENEAPENTLQIA